MSKCQIAMAWIMEVGIRIIMAIAIILVNDDKLFPPFVRFKTVNSWSDCNYPHQIEGTIPYMAVVITSVLVPFGIIIIACLISFNTGWDAKKAKFKRILREFGTGLLALTIALLTTELITDLIKNWGGRHRPDFLSRCYTPPAMQIEDGEWLTLPSRNQAEWALTDLQRNALTKYGRNGTETIQNQSSVFFPYIEDVPTMLTTDLCYPGGKVDAARRSFPSGHTSMAFCGATFSALLGYFWLSKWQYESGFEKLRIPGSTLGVSVFFCFFLPALYTAISRTQDYRHFAGDIIAGGIIGTVVTYICFIQYYDLHLFDIQQRIHAKYFITKETSS